MAGVSFERLAGTVGRASQSMADKLESYTASMDPDNMSTADMINMQRMVQQWTITSQLESTIVKTLSDTLKGIIQKM